MLHSIFELYKIQRYSYTYLRQRLGDYSLGFVRYENEMDHSEKKRVVWEFEWDPDVELVKHPGIEGRYFTSPPWHHQGMFMATRLQLLAWKTREPDCKKILISGCF